MEQAPENVESRLLGSKTLEAANDPVIAGARPATGWDPFEIWRTRVRSPRQLLPKEGQDSTD